MPKIKEESKRAAKKKQNKQEQEFQNKNPSLVKKELEEREMMKIPNSKVEAELAKKDGVSIVDLVYFLIEEARNLKSSDIHIDPEEKSTRVRFRIDGILHDVHALPKEIHAEVISRIKVLSGLRTDEHQAAQDGRFRIEVGGEPIDIRVSIAPTHYGENAVLRLLVSALGEFSLDSLGFSENDLKKVRDAISKPYGMILSTGPTGSGKTTTLYSILKELNKPSVAIITIEDPVEYSIEGVEQIQVNPRTNLTFANGLRSILRQDPDIIMVGEIRDEETASIAVNAALTGHLLLSTLHTNDAPTTLPRLLDMKIEPFLIASTVNVAIGQRLVRKICEKCKKERKLSKEEIDQLREIVRPEIIAGKTTVYYGANCEECGNSGYSGRIGIYEVMLVDDEIRMAILRRASSDEIKKIAIKNGMTTMIEDGMKKVFEGITTIEEILRVTKT